MSSHRYVVDRIEGRGADAQAVLVDDVSARTVAIDARRLPPGTAAEGAVLDVPVGADGPVWARAVRDRAEEARRTAAHRTTLDARRRRDPGGDVVL